MLEINKISKYLITQFVKAIINFTLLVALIILLVDFTENIRRYGSYEEVSFLEIILVTLYKFPNLLVETSPFIILFSSLFSIRTIVLKRELDIYKACGLSIWRFLKPFTIVILAYSFLIIIVVSPLSVISSDGIDQIEKKSKQKDKNATEDVLVVSDKNVWMIIRGSNEKEYYMLAKSILKNTSYDQEKTILKEITVFEIEQSKLNTMMLAKDAIVQKNKIIFNDVFLKTQQGKLPRLEKEVIIETLSKNSGIAKLNTDPEKLFIWQIPSVIKNLNSVSLDTKPYYVYFYNLLSFPILLLTMLFISTRFSLYDLRKGKNLYAIFATILSGVAAYFIGNFLITVGTSMSLSPLIAVLFAKVIVMLISLYSLFIKEGL
jgi:lipopolysaccharide export system permease protein